MERKILTKEEVVDFTIRAVYNFISELMGVGIYMFVGCIGCVMGLVPKEDTVGYSLSFAISVMVGMEVALEISGAHLNPILTVAGMFFKRLSIPMGIIYIFGQFSGSLLGFGLVKALTPHQYYNKTLCCTIPHENIHIAQAVFIEFSTSTVLVFLVCAQWNPRNTRMDSVSLRVGFTVFCLVFSTVHLTGGSMNPARSFGPAVWNNSWKDHWIYWLGPFAASFIWAPIYKKVFIDLAPKEKEVE